jgi:apolipoprotein N-acyltransferase
MGGSRANGKWLSASLKPMKKTPNRESSKEPKQRARLLPSVLWALTGIGLGAAYVSPGSFAGALWGVAFAFCLVLACRVLPSPRWWEMMALGFVGHATGFYWVPHTIRLYGEVSMGTAYLGAMVLFLFLSLQFVFFAWIRRGLAAKTIYRYSLSVPLAWFCAELLFPKLLPWSLGQTQLWFLALAQSADIIGPSLISFFLLWWAALAVDGVFVLCQKQHSRFAEKAGLLVVTIALTLFYGGYRRQSLGHELDKAPSLHVGLIQGNLDPFRDYFDGKMEERIDKLRAISDNLLGRHQPDFLVWPESSVGYDYYTDEVGSVIERSRDPYPGLGVPLVFGGQARLRRISSAKPEYYNAAFVRSSAGEISSLYRKQVLFHFSERVPLAQYFPALEKLRTKDYIMLSSTKERPLSLPVHRIYRDRPLRVTAAICFEDMWPEVFLDQSWGEESDLLLVITNDSWFMSTTAAKQHYLVSAWRAIELRRSFLRATNDGITAIVNPIGEETHSFPAHLEGALYADDVKIVKTQSIFSRLGPWPAKIVAILILAYALIRLLRAVRVKF